MSSLHEPTPEASRSRHPGVARRAHSRTARHALRDRPRGRHQPARPGRGRAAGVRARARAGCARPGSRSSSTRPATSSAGCSGATPICAEVWSGSHLDTPPDGGRFDGALGTLLALDAAEAMRADGPPRRTRGGHGVPARGGSALRSRLLRQPRGVRHARRRRGRSRRSATASRSPRPSRRSATASCPRTGWLDPPPAAFVEAHIEQGPTLAAMGAPLGIVTSIAGMAGLELTFTGRRGHAGTVQMAAPLRRARRRRTLRRRRSRRRPRAARRGRDDRPHDGRARRDEHDSRALRAVRRRCARPTTSGSRPWWRA